MIGRFSTCRVEPSKRLDFWNQLVGATCDGLGVDSPNRSLNAEMLRWQLGDNTLVWPKSPAASVERLRSRFRRSEDRKMRLNVSAFYNKYNNIILTLTSINGFSPALEPANVGKENVWSIEGETTIRPFEGLTPDGSASYLHFKWTDTGSSGVPLTDVTPYRPKFNYSFGVQYDWPIKPGLISARFDGSYQSTIHTDAFNASSNRIDSRFLGNAHLSYTTNDKAWSLTLEVQNVFDKYYFVTIVDAKNAFGTVSGSPGLPRTWAVTIKRTF